MQHTYGTGLAGDETTWQDQFCHLQPVHSTGELIWLIVVDAGEWEAQPVTTTSPLHQTLAHPDFHAAQGAEAAIRMEAAGPHCSLLKAVALNAGHTITKAMTKKLCRWRGLCDSMIDGMS